MAWQSRCGDWGCRHLKVREGQVHFQAQPMLVGQIEFLAGHWIEGPGSCHSGLSVGQVTLWPLAIREPE